MSSLPNARSDCSLKLGRGSSQVLSFQTDLMITTHGEGHGCGVGVHSSGALDSTLLELAIHLRPFVNRPYLKPERIRSGVLAPGALELPSGPPRHDISLRISV